MVTKSESALAEFDFETISISQSDFLAPGEDGGGGTATSADEGEVTEVMRAEIGEDGQLSSYDLVRLGQSLDAGNRDSAKGKIFIDLRAADGTEIDQRTQVRFAVRPKNQNRRTALTSFIPLRDLNVERPDHRIPLTPVTSGGRPAFAKSGRVLIVEVRNTAADIEVDREESDMDVPARAGY